MGQNKNLDSVLASLIFLAIMFGIMLGMVLSDSSPKGKPSINQRAPR